MPDRLPSHTTFQPLPRKCSATASAGKICPPVPPAMIMIVRLKTKTPFHRRGADVNRTERDGIGPPASYCVAAHRTRFSYRVTPHNLSVLPIDPQQDGNGAAGRYKRASTEGNERQGQSFRGQHSHVDADVHYRLHAYPKADALCDERGERALQPPSAASDREGTRNDPHECE